MPWLRRALIRASQRQRQGSPNFPDPKTSKTKTKTAMRITSDGSGAANSSDRVRGAVWCVRARTRAHSFSQTLPGFRSLVTTPKPLPRTPPHANLHAGRSLSSLKRQSPSQHRSRLILQGRIHDPQQKCGPCRRPPQPSSKLPPELRWSGQGETISIPGAGISSTSSSVLPRTLVFGAGGKALLSPAWQPFPAGMKSRQALTSM